MIWNKKKVQISNTLYSTSFSILWHYVFHLLGMPKVENREKSILWIFLTDYFGTYGSLFWQVSVNLEEVPYFATLFFLKMLLRYDVATKARLDDFPFVSSISFPLAIYFRGKHFRSKMRSKTSPPPIVEFRASFSEM